MNNLIIAGIDPGTTIGYAILDINSSLIKAGSSKQLDLNNIISKITNYGKVIAVGTDKKKIPSFIEKFAVKTGARIISPKEDLKVIDKKETTKKYKTKNNHEMDALASALFAFKELRPLLKKVDVFARNHKKEHYSEKIKDIVISKDISINSALNIIEKPLNKKEKIIKKVINKKEFREKDFIELYSKLKSIRKINQLLKKSNKKLRKELEKTKRKHKYFDKKINQLITDEKAMQLIEQKEDRLNSLYQQLSSKDEEIAYLNNRIKRLYEIISNAGKNIMLKKLKNLGYNEFDAKNRMLNITEGDILLVDDANIFSEKTINLLKDKVNIIIYKKPVSKKIRKKFNFIFIDSKKLKINEDSYFATIGKKEFEKNKKSIDILKKILEEYKDEKKR